MNKLEQKYQTTIEKVAFNVWLSRDAIEYIKGVSGGLDKIEDTQGIMMLLYGQDRFKEDMSVLKKLDDQGVNYIYFNQ